MRSGFLLGPGVFFRGVNAVSFRGLVSENMTGSISVGIHSLVAMFSTESHPCHPLGFVTRSFMCSFFQGRARTKFTEDCSSEMQEQTEPMEP